MVVDSLKKLVVVLWVAMFLVAVVTGASTDASTDADAPDKRYRCTTCGEVIDSEMFSTGGKHYHARHFRCEQCDWPIKDDFTVYKGNNYHDFCFKSHVARRCALCDGVIQGEYIIDFWGNDYHIKHQHDASSCEFCHRFISEGLTGGGRRLDDGRSVCNICNATAVTNQKNALRLLTQVSRRLERFGMKVDLGEIRLRMVGHKELQRLAKRRTDSLRGFTDYREDKNFFGRVTKRDIDVYVLHGMPETEVLATLAHELAHVWQFLRGRLKNDRAWREGSCNYASYLVLSGYDDDEARYAMQNLLDDPDPVYGEGFRRVKRFAEEKGNARWVALLAKKTRFPSGY